LQSELLMKRSLLFIIGSFVVAAIWIPAQAEKRISVAQFEQTVAALKNAADSEAAQRISELQLTERLSPLRLATLSQTIPGEKFRQALRAIADQSAFLPPPSSEIPSNPAPPVAEQRRIMGLVATYVEHTIPQLPNFFATRTTDHFEDTPLVQHAGDFFTPYRPLHFLSHSEAAVFYQKGREVVDTKAGSSRQNHAREGLTTWGVFGPILGTVLVDAASSKLQWSHWESGSTVPIVAVFEFHVPQEKSHYEVNYCCVASQAATYAADVRPFRRIVPYHGSMTVDPATGVILRLTVEADLKPADPVTKASILVDYGSIEIGGKNYICPIRSISTTAAQMVQVDPKYKFALANQIQPVKTSLNDVAFNNYHMFRADMRVLTPEEADLVQQAQAGPNAIASAAEPAPSPGARQFPPAVTIPSAESKPGPAIADPEPAPTSVAPGSTTSLAATRPEEPATPEITTTASSGLPDIPSSSAPTPNDTGYRLRTTTRLVEVTVVAFDKKGHPVTDLKPTDFEIYDNGSKQMVSSLAQAAAAAASQPASSGSKPESGEQSFRNRSVEPSSTLTTSPQRLSTNTTVFLIDSSHVAFSDLSHARNEMLRFLKTVPADEPVALYVLRKYSFEVLREPTTDHEQLAITLRNWMPSAQDLAQAQSEEQRNRQQMEYVHSVGDLLSVNGNTSTGEADVLFAPDPQRRSLGDHPEQSALGHLVWVARHLAAFKGHKSLIWVASDNVLADFSEKAPSVEKGDKYLEPLALRTREALNEAQISIYPLDASQLETGGVSASLQRGNVQLNPTVDETVQLQQLPPGLREEAEEALKKSKKDINPGRLTAQMQQDTHPIQGTFRELAQATGGRALRRASDIAAELDSIVNDGRAAYTLGFTPDTAADGSYHHIVVKTANRRDITLRYRTGYLYEKEPATLKERFQNAVWHPADQSEIALSATPARDGKAASLKLNIAATDIALAEQAGLWTDKLYIFLVQRDDAKLHGKLEGQTLSLRLKPSTYQQVLRDGINIDETIRSLPENGALRVVVVDENTGRIGTLTLPVTALNRK
jgi:VWFA-related protein